MHVIWRWAVTSNTVAPDALPAYKGNCCTGKMHCHSCCLCWLRWIYINCSIDYTLFLRRHTGEWLLLEKYKYTGSRSSLYLQSAVSNWIAMWRALLQCCSSASL